MASKSTVPTAILPKPATLATTTPMAMLSMTVKRTSTSTVSWMLEKPIQPAEKIQVMRTKMGFKIGKRISPAPFGTWPIPTSVASMTVRSGTSATAPIHVTRSSISKRPLFNRSLVADWKLAMAQDSTPVGVWDGTTCQEHGNPSRMLPLSTTSSPVYPTRRQAQQPTWPTATAHSVIPPPLTPEPFQPRNSIATMITKTAMLTASPTGKSFLGPLDGSPIRASPTVTLTA